MLRSSRAGWALGRRWPAGWSLRRSWRPGRPR